MPANPYGASQQANSVLTGNNVALQIGDTIVMFAQTVGDQLSMGTEQLYGVGTQKPQEVIQLRMSPAITLDNFELTDAGVALLAGNTRLENILAGNQFDIHLIENTSTVLATYVGCKAQNVSRNTPANAPIRKTFSFLAIDVLDANGNSIMDDGNNAISVVSNLTSTAITAGTIGIVP